MSILCGNCHHHHENVAAVRACHQGAPVVNSSIEENRTYASKAQNALPMSAKQLNFLTKLFTERGRSATWIENRTKGLNMSQASALISETLKTPKGGPVTNTSPAVPSVPAGRYALVVEGETKFFRVDRPTQGPWAGRTFVKVQASDEFYSIKGSTAHRVLELIAADPKAASIRYGHELGACGICGRTLTDETSRANGIGPICAGKAGW